MLEPRWEWRCEHTGCCVFVGGTEDFDIYMGKCHERPWDPMVLLIKDDRLEYEFETQGAFAKNLDKIDDRSGAERAALGLALTFVQCFFPTPERVAMDKIAKGEPL